MGLRLLALTEIESGMRLGLPTSRQVSPAGWLTRLQIPLYKERLRSVVAHILGCHSSSRICDSCIPTTARRVIDSDGGIRLEGAKARKPCERGCILRVR